MSQAGTEATSNTPLKIDVIKSLSSIPHVQLFNAVNRYPIEGDKIDEDDEAGNKNKIDKIGKIDKLDKEGRIDEIGVIVRAGYWGASSLLDQDLKQMLISMTGSEIVLFCKNWTSSWLEELYPCITHVHIDVDVDGQLYHPSSRVRKNFKPKLVAMYANQHDYLDAEEVLCNFPEALFAPRDDKLHWPKDATQLFSAHLSARYSNHGVVKEALRRYFDG